MICYLCLSRGPHVGCSSIFQGNETPVYNLTTFSALVLDFRHRLTQDSFRITVIALKTCGGGDREVLNELYSLKRLRICSSLYFPEETWIEKVRGNICDRQTDIAGQDGARLNGV